LTSADISVIITAIKRVGSRGKVNKAFLHMALAYPKISPYRELPMPRPGEERFFINRIEADDEWK